MLIARFYLRQTSINDAEEERSDKVLRLLVSMVMCSAHSLIILKSWIRVRFQML